MTSLKVTVMGSASPIIKEPSVAVEVTLVIVGYTPSMTKALLPPRELPLSIAGKVKVASLVAASLIVPLFRASELVAT